MDPLTASMIIGGAGIVGSVLGGREANAANSAQAARQMAFQADMSGTAHQREVEDLRKAGLNPILSALGSGSSTPAGASGNMVNVGEGISKGLDTALAVRQQAKEFQVRDAQIQNIKADTANKAANAALIANQANSTALDIKTKSLNNQVLEKTLNSIIKKAKAEGDYSELNQIMNIINSGASSAGQLMNPFKNLIPQIPLKTTPTPKGKP